MGVAVGLVVNTQRRSNEPLAQPISANVVVTPREFKLVGATRGHNFELSTPKSNGSAAQLSSSFYSGRTKEQREAI